MKKKDPFVLNSVNKSSSIFIYFHKFGCCCCCIPKVEHNFSYILKYIKFQIGKNRAKNSVSYSLLYIVPIVIYVWYKNTVKNINEHHHNITENQFDGMKSTLTQFIPLKEKKKKENKQKKWRNFQSDDPPHNRVNLHQSTQFKSRFDYYYCHQNV